MGYFRFVYILFGIIKRDEDRHSCFLCFVLVNRTELLTNKRWYWLQIFALQKCSPHLFLHFSQQQIMLTVCLFLKLLSSTVADIDVQNNDIIINDDFTVG